MRCTENMRAYAPRRPGVSCSASPLTHNKTIARAASAPVQATTAAVGAAAFEEFLLDTQKKLLADAEILDGSGKTFITDRWERGSDNAGYGITCVLEGGNLLEKAAANISIVRGRLSGARAQAMSSRGRSIIDPAGGQPYSAAALSLVFHAAHPLVPTLRADVRLFQVAGQSWFGGGCDLTPTYLFEEDAKEFHSFWKQLCDRYHSSIYPEQKAWCDRYFYIPARKEHRGIGGLFFDDLEAEGAPYNVQAYVQDVALGILDSWQAIAQRRRVLPFTEAQRTWQLLRRGRYLEFNLLYDRGVKFGLDGGRVESIMVSAPPLIAWKYNVVPEPGSEEEKLVQLGEGGYAFVYLAKELPTAERPFAEADAPIAIKKILAASGEKLREAKQEVEVLKQLSHINCLPLLDHAIHQNGQNNSSLAYTVLLVFPAYQDGNLADELERLGAAGQKLSSRQVLDIFRQVCAGVGHMHSRGYAHMDIKPHNVLIKRPKSPSWNRQQQQQPVLQASPSRLVPPSTARTMAGEDEEAETEDEGSEDLGADRSLMTRDYEAVLMDFGSARRLPVEVNSRADALALQEEAEARCTATYRAPELFDVPSQCLLEGKADVWALGCTLYALMYGASPFQQALDQGASLALAVINCRIPWPKSPAWHYPQPLHDLVTCCLQEDPARRPTVPQLLTRIDEISLAASVA